MSVEPESDHAAADGGGRHRHGADQGPAGGVRPAAAPTALQLFLGGRTWDDLYDFDALRELSYDHDWFDVVPVVERADADDPGGAERGTLADVVTRYGAWAGHDVLVCGSPAMIRATVSRMLVAGTPLDRIRYDPFTVD